MPRAKKEKGDPVILSGDVKYRMEDLLKRRRGTALSGQHRENQRLDKEIMILRSALGLKPEPPKEIVRTQRMSKDPVSGENLAISSVENDVPWLRKITVNNLAKLQNKLSKLGYNYKSESSTNLIKHIWEGYKHGLPDNLVVTTIGRDWTIAADLNGKRLELFNFERSENAMEKAIPSEMSKADWDGNLDEMTKQKYASNWLYLIKLV